jgi:hypothetical protein
MLSKPLMRRMDQNRDLTREHAAQVLPSTQSCSIRQRTVPVTFAVSPAWTARVVIGCTHRRRRESVSHVPRLSHKTSHGTRLRW